jgi:hypothetical protein
MRRRRSILSSIVVWWSTPSTKSAVALIFGVWPGTAKKVIAS